MQISKTKPIAIDTLPRQMTKEAMQMDFEYEMAQKITKNMLESGLISSGEYDRISALNIEKFSPFYGDLMDI